MANIFGVNLETPAEQQKRLLEEVAQKRRQNAGNPYSKVGFEIGNLIQGVERRKEAQAKEDQFEALDEGRRLGNIEFVEQQFESTVAAQQQKIVEVMKQQGAAPAQIAQALKAHAAGAQRQKAQVTQQATQADVIDAKQHFIAKGADPINAELMSMANAASRLRALGGADNIALANQINANMTELTLAKRSREAEMKKLKAQTGQAETAMEINERNLDEALTIPELEERLKAADSDMEKAKWSGLIARKEREMEEDKDYAFMDQYVQNEDGTTSVQRVAVNKADPTEVVPIGAPQNELPKMSAAAEKEMMTAQNNYIKAEGSENNIATLIGALDSVQLSGKAAAASEASKALFGTEDLQTVIRKRIESIRISGAIDNLPPGVASDKDIELVLSGTIPSTANPEALRRYLIALANVEAATAAYSRFKANYLSENGNSRGLIGAWNNLEDKGLRKYGDPLARPDQAPIYPTPDGAPIETREERKNRILGGG